VSERTKESRKEMQTEGLNEAYLKYIAGKLKEKTDSLEV
jgi:hypothetical protein